MPLLFLFIALGWLGVLPRLYPWGHLAALLVFTVLFSHAFGQAHALWRQPGEGAARRRLEQASGLDHRPLDVLADHLSEQVHPAQQQLWHTYRTRTQARLTALRWPTLQLQLAQHDRYNLRYILLVLLIIGAVTGWGALGGRLIAAINPALGSQLVLLNPTLDAWITPPEYTGLPPIMIATPAGMRHDSKTIDVPEGSMLSAHLMERDGDAPVLVTDSAKTEFSNDSHGDFGIVAALDKTASLKIRHGWQSIGAWHLNMVADQPPQIAFTEPPGATDRKAMRLSYEASDDYGVTAVSVRIAPRESIPGASNDPIELPLAAPEAKQVKRVSFEDMTSHLWAGSPVKISLIATDAAGHRTESAAVDFTLPEKTFFNPLARILIDERKKLIQHADSDSERNDIANVMAGISHQPASYKGDPVVLMALRAGAVRLVLDHAQEATSSVGTLLWQTAVRIEDGSSGAAERNLREAQRDLADALDRNAGEKEIQKLIDRLHQALTQYLAELSTRMASRPMPPEGLTQNNGTQTNMLTPRDLQRMLDHLRDLSATGSRDAAKQELANLQKILENIQTQPRPQWTTEQKQMLQELAALHAIARQQQQVLDQTFRQSQTGKSDPALVKQQTELQAALQSLMQALKPDQPKELGQGATAMKQAGDQLKQGNEHGALPRQNEAVQSLQKALQAMAQNMRSSMQQGQSGGDEIGNADPFGRQNGMMHQENVKVPDQMEVRRVREILNELQRRSGDMGRSKTERDYIDRLLQDF